MDPDGKISTLVNLLSQQNSILDDMLAAECQSGNAFEYTQVVKLPTPQRRSYNQGVVRTMAGVAKQVTTCSEYADWATIDASLARLGGNLGELRAQEDFLHMEGMNQQIASDLFYSNRASDPTAFTGLANIYNTVNPATSQIARNVIDCGGTGSDNTSMWMITWGPKHIHTIFPKGLPAGIQHKDFGLLPIVDAAGNEFIAYRTWLQWNIGLAIHDWRFAVRAANIDVSDLTGGSAANLLSVLAQMVMKPPVMPAGVGPVQRTDDPRVVTGRSAIYLNRTAYLALEGQVTNKSNILLQLKEWGGMTVLTYRGIPIRIVDAILNTESRVV
jgi:hypothetical protein